MAWSIALKILSYIFFSASWFSSLVASEFDYGQIIKLKDSRHFIELAASVQSLPISASSAAIMDVQNESFLLEKNSDQTWPIASISKLMSVLVLLEDLEIDLDESYVLQAGDHRTGGRDYLFKGEELSRRDFLALALIVSDNTAVIALISSTGRSEEDFVKLMNDKAQNLGLKNTFFRDATGLSPANISTAREVSLLLKRALSHEVVSDLVKKYNYQVTTKQGRVKNIQSTNELLNYSDPEQRELEIIGGKTGYNDLSGYCLGTEFSFQGRKYISVILNASTLSQRFSDTVKLVDRVVDAHNPD